MPAVGGTVEVRGLRELQRAFQVADRDAGLELRKTFRAAAEPVRVDAERLALTGIRHIGMSWSRMRVGITTSTVYVAPRERGLQGRRNPRLKRPNLAGLLLDRSMEPALAANREKIIGEVEQALGVIANRWASV